MRAPMACAYFAFVSCDPWHVRSMLSLSFAINSSSDPPSEIEHGKFSGKAPFECTDCPFTVCLLLRLPVHPLPVHRLPVPVACSTSACSPVACHRTSVSSLPNVRKTIARNGRPPYKFPDPQGSCPGIEPSLMKFKSSACAD